MTGIAPFTQNSIQVVSRAIIISIQVVSRAIIMMSLWAILKKNGIGSMGPLSDRQMTPMGKLTNS
jgi:hypothetical protein